MWRTGIKYFLTSSRTRRELWSVANAANSWPHLHNTHQASLSLRQLVNSRLRHTRTYTHDTTIHFTRIPASLWAPSRNVLLYPCCKFRAPLWQFKLFNAVIYLIFIKQPNCLCREREMKQFQFYANNKTVIKSPSRNKGRSPVNQAALEWLQ